ncbi:MAG TPA: glutamate--tRNA ligase, partial [Gammaproteobacteria bacterium]|nr:glutamate--tRNA ligase [Gammaproteobacteria bacterium]
DWLNQHYIKTTNAIDAFIYQLRALGMDITQGPSVFAVYDAQKERVKTLREMAEKSRYFYEDAVEYDEAAVKKHLTDEAKDLLKSAALYFEKLSDWTQESLHQAIQAIAAAQGVKMGQLAQPLRVAVTGNTVSPSIDLTLALVGKERVMERLLSKQLEQPSAFSH